MPGRFICLALALALACATFAGCGDATPIDSMTLYSLDGTYEADRDKKPAGEMFHEYPVLGKLVVASARDRLEIVKAVEKGLAENSEPAKCFWPRHGVKLTRGGKTVEYLICFHCNQLVEYLDGNRARRTVSRSPAAVLDKHLKDAGVPQQTADP